MKERRQEESSGKGKVKWFIKTTKMGKYGYINVHLVVEIRVQFQFCYLLFIYLPWQEAQIRRINPRLFFSVWQSFSFLYAWIFKKSGGREERDKIGNFPLCGHTLIKGTAYT